MLKNQSKVLNLSISTLKLNFDQILSAARQVHVVYLAQVLGAVLFIHIISNHDILVKWFSIYLVLWIWSNGPARKLFGGGPGGGGFEWPLHIMLHTLSTAYKK